MPILLSGETLSLFSSHCEATILYPSSSLRVKKLFSDKLSMSGKTVETDTRGSGLNSATTVVTGYQAMHVGTGEKFRWERARTNQMGISERVYMCRHSLPSTVILLMCILKHLFLNFFDIVYPQL